MRRGSRAAVASLAIRRVAGQRYAVEHRQALGAAIDAEGRCALHTVSSDSPSHLWQLLDACGRHHGMPGLLNVPLECGDGTLASSPREAIQKFYSSAVDALVIGRFLLMKDYWLLRSDLG